MKATTSILAAFALVSAASITQAQPYVISTFAGGAAPQTPIAAGNMAIDPRALASGPSGILYFISSTCVFKLDQNGIVTHAAGSSRKTGYTGDGGPALGAELRTPSGLAIDAAGDIFIADASDYRVRKVSPDGLISTVAGTGVQGYSGDGASATIAQLSRPTGLTTDTQGNLFIVDGVRVRKVSLSGTITTVAGNGTIGFSGDGGPATGAQLNLPYGVAVDSAGTLYISGDGSLRVRKVSPNGIITTVAGTGVSGNAGDGGPAMSAQLAGAAGIAVDAFDNLYLAESDPESDAYECPSCIRKIPTAGTITTVAVGPGLIEPRALAIDQAGTLYIAETGTRRIRKISPDGDISIVAGNGGSTSYGGDGGPVTGAQFFWPTGVAIDADGSVYVADTFNNRVRVVSTAGIIAPFAGDGTQSFSGDGGPAANAALYFPTAVAGDGHGNVFIADHGHSRIRKVSKTGAITTVLSGSAVWGLAVDKDGNLYLPDPGGAITTVAGNGAFGYSGDGGPATSAQIRLTGKTAIATGRDGSLYFSDDDSAAPAPGAATGGSVSTPRIRKVSAGGIITTVAGNGTSGYSGDGGPATAATVPELFILRTSSIAPSACCSRSAPASQSMML